MFGGGFRGFFNGMEEDEAQQEDIDSKTFNETLSL